MPTSAPRLLALAACVAALTACATTTEVPSALTFGGALNGAKEKPTATASIGTGQALVVLNASGTIHYSVSWTGLTGVATGAHIHGPADSLNTAGILIDFSALPVGSANQAITLTASGLASGSVNVKGDAVVTATVSGDSLVKLLTAGLLYVNVHTAANPSGEIRTQLQR